MIATSGIVAAPECNKFHFGPGCAPDHAGGAHDDPLEAIDGWGREGRDGDGVVFYVPANTVSVIWKTVFTGQKTQPTVSKY